MGTAALYDDPNFGSERTLTVRKFTKEV